MLSRSSPAGRYTSSRGVSPGPGSSSGPALVVDVHGALRPACLSDPELDLGEDFTKPGRDCVKGKECRKLRENLTVGHRSRRRGSRLGEGRQKGGSKDCVKAWGDVARNKVLKHVYQATETLRVVH